MTQKLVGAPFLRQFDSGAAEVAVILVELALESAEKRESVSGRAGKSGENFVLIETANLLRAMLDDRVAKRDLPIAGHDNFVVAANAEYGGRADTAGRRQVCRMFRRWNCRCEFRHECNS